jgi:hypothetical protein
MRALLILGMAAALLAPGAAYAFDVDTAGSVNSDGSARFSDPDDGPAIPGLQVFGVESAEAQSGGVFIPQSPASSDAPFLLYSSPAFRAH